MTLDDALSAWLAHLSSLGVDMRAELNPPATAAEIAAAEVAIGFEFPEDLRALYLLADGQRDPGDHRQQPHALLFGRYSFESLERALIEYRSWQSVRDDAGADFNTIYDWTDARPGDPVHGDYWHPGWFPFSTDWGGNGYAIDLAPASGGTYGQVIAIGRDEDERRVLAPCLSAFLASAAARRAPVVDRDGNMMLIEMEEER